MTLLLKDPDAVLDYSIDWGAEYLGDDLIAGSTWSVDPDEPDGVTIAGSDFDATSSTVKAAGGAAGKIYKLINEVTLQSGRVDDRSVVLRVEKR
jgi:hypothetical protein